LYSSVLPVTETVSLSIHTITIVTAGSDTERIMNKVIIALMAIYFIGDPDLQYLAWLGDLKVYIVAAAIALVSMPWITAQLDG
jgi:hypothetical protein